MKEVMCCCFLIGVTHNLNDIKWINNFFKMPQLKKKNHCYVFFLINNNENVKHAQYILTSKYQSLIA